MARNEQRISAIVGIRNGGEIVMLDYVFDDGKGFKGAVGTVFSPLNAAYIRYRRLLTTIEEAYGCVYDEMSKREQKSYGSLRKFAKAILEECDYSAGLFPGHDTSDTYHLSDDDMKRIRRKFGRGVKALECVGGGRCFTAGQEWDEVWRPDLLELINQYES